MTEYIVAFEDDIGGIDAINKSKKMMHGHKMRLFKLHFSFIGWYLLAVLTFGIGAIFLAPYVKAAETEFYLDLVGQSNQEEHHYVDEDDIVIEYL